MELKTVLKLTALWNEFTIQLPVVDTPVEFMGITWERREDRHRDYLLATVPDGEYVEWIYNRNGGLALHRFTMSEERLQGITPVLRKLEELINDERYFSFCDEGHSFVQGRERDDDIDSLGH